MLKKICSLGNPIIISMMVSLGVCGLTVSSSVVAQTVMSGQGKTTGIPEKKPDGTWEGLNLGQQKILAPLESDWDYMLPDSRKKWIQVANLYPKMSAADKERLQSRMASWSNLSQKDRRLARENYLSSLKFPAEKKAEAWSAYQKLSDEQKKKLAQTETNKKKPTAVNAPTLQQHPVMRKPNLAPTPPAGSAAAPPPETPALSTGSDTTPSDPKL